MAQTKPENDKPQTRQRKDYTAPDFQISHIDLLFDLKPDKTYVRATSTVTRQQPGQPLILDGEGIILHKITIDGKSLSAEDYRLTDHHLMIPAVPDHFKLMIESYINPAENKALEGLYMSKGIYCTQCEAEGFRRITWFLDRPDVMARYRVRIEADKKSFPVLLAGGNQIAAGDLDHGRHYAVWEDPWPKPCYLFALVAGDLSCFEDHIITRSGKRVVLRIFVAPADLDKCAHAMASLKKAFVWDEEVYNLEYDLEIFNIVAVSHFNMGAMENKSLNIFNSQCVLARPETATDNDFAAVEAVVAHEYFHNWTGNRVTCRDWFQLSLKEGLTVFRDQEFSADMGSRAVKRIEDVTVLRQQQFAEDSSPMAHPIRPDSYIEINNFYTVTVYEKGAEVIRMLHNLLGAAAYRKGMDLYFARHDGQAVTCDDFVAAMADASGVDLDQFRLWYGQAGTPEITMSYDYDPAAATLNLTLSQHIPDTPGQTAKKPMHIPVAVGLLGPDGADRALHLAGEDATDQGDTTRILSLTQPQQTFRFTGLTEAVVPSILRGFSAPVKVKDSLSRADRLFLLSHDSDSFNRWQAGQTLATDVIMGLVDDLKAGRDMVLDQEFSEAIGHILSLNDLDAAFRAMLLNLPAENLLSQYQTPVLVDEIHQARAFVRRRLAQIHRGHFIRIYQEYSTTALYDFNPDAVGRRSLKNMALSYLMTLAEPGIFDLCQKQFATTDNMTDEIAAFAALLNAEAEGPQQAMVSQAITDFYDKWHHDDLVLDKWFAVQAGTSKVQTLARIQTLLQHPDFDLATPNRVRSVVGVFCGRNPVCFHDKSGQGYDFLGDVIARLDPINPQIAARLVQPLGRWQIYDPARQALMKGVLTRISKLPDLSENTYEIVTKSLQQC